MGRAGIPGGGRWRVRSGWQTSGKETVICSAVPHLRDDKGVAGPPPLFLGLGPVTAPRPPVTVEVPFSAAEFERGPPTLRPHRPRLDHPSQTVEQKAVEDYV